MFLNNRYTGDVGLKGAQNQDAYLDIVTVDLGLD